MNDALKTLDCGLCVLRRWRPDDLEPLLRYANNDQIAANMRDQFHHPYTLDDGRDWLQQSTGPLAETAWAITLADEAVGGIGLMPQSDINAGTAGIGYWLGQPFWRRGIATAAVSVLSHHAITRMSFRRLFATTLAHNLASQRVLAKAGYRREGVLRRSAIKRGNVYDQVLFALTKDDVS